MRLRLLYFLIAFSFFGLSNAQDIHFSQYYASPLTLNPALTGKFDGLYRISGIYRGQSYGLVSGPSLYRTPSVAVDFSLLKDKMKGNALGVGAAFVNDQQGNATKISANTIYVSVAYTLCMGKNKNYQIGLGFTPTYTMKNTKDNYIYPEELGYNASTGTIEPIYSNFHESLAATRKNYFNLATGLFFNMKPKDWLTFYVGGSMSNILRPKVSFLNSPDDAKLPFRFLGHGGFEIGVDKKNHKWTLIPGFLYQNMSKANEANVGMTVGYNIVNDTTKNKKATIFLGLWNRMGSDVQSAFAYRNITPKIGFEYNNFRVNFAYDIDLNKMRYDSKSAGKSIPMAYELAVSYIGFGSTPPKENTWLFNPRY